MTELLCLKDAYLKECTAKAIEVNGKEVVFDKTVFYPVGGGLVCDTGLIQCKNKSYNVVEVRKKDGKIIHTLDLEGITGGEECILKIDWEKRYGLMRMHTAAHVLGSVMFDNAALITGNQIKPEESRFDFSLENFDRQKFEEMVAKANEKLASGAEVKVYDLPREEAFKIPGTKKPIFKTSTADKLHDKFDENFFDLVVTHKGMEGQEFIGIENIVHLLKPGGEALISFGTDYPHLMSNLTEPRFSRFYTVLGLAEHEETVRIKRWEAHIRKN